jgi:hypothetical protein
MLWELKTYWNANLKSLDDVIILNQTRIVKKTIFLQTFIPEIGKKFYLFLW